jgi:hypothetical protein
MRLLPAAFAASLLLMPACASGQTTGREGGTAIPPTPVAVRNILYARPFAVERPFLTWSRDRAKASAGVLVVLEVDPAYVDPRDAVVNPVLYAGNVAVIRLNRGNESGRVIGIIPGDIDLASALIWFGSPELPERITADMVQAERSRAEKAGVRPFGAERIAGVRRAPVRTTDVAALLRDIAADLVDEFSPQEKALADTWRLPEASAAPQRK